MIERAGRWAIRDVVIDGVSVAANYRAQFFRVIQSSSYQELIRQMRTRVPEAVTAPLVATAMADDVAIVSVAPAVLPIDVVTRPAGSPADEVGTSARSDVRLQLDLNMTLVARAVPESTSVPPNAGGDVVVDEPELMAPRPDAHSQPRPLEPVAARPASASNGRSYWVQVGAFRSPEAARRLAALLVEPELSGSGRPAAVMESWAGDTLLTRVRVGPFADRREAAAKLRAIEARGYKPFIAAERE